jgi:hypothetical protein
MKDENLELEIAKLIAENVMVAYALPTPDGLIDPDTINVSATTAMGAASAVIRRLSPSARNEALEEAAALVADNAFCLRCAASGSDGDDPAWAQADRLEQAAKAIRALKHQPAQG